MLIHQSFRFVVIVLAFVVLILFQDRVDSSVTSGLVLLCAVGLAPYGALRRILK